jgi:prephenate dehydrogenase
MFLSDYPVTIVGLGLIGGSMAKALRRAGFRSIYGFDTDSDALLLAEAARAINKGYDSPAEALALADLVILCVHPNDLSAFIADNAAYFKQGALLTDTAGVRRGLNAKVMDALKKTGRTDLRFVGGHPMAGKEDSGFRNSDPDIFRGASYLLTPAPETLLDDVEVVTRLALAIGCESVRSTDEPTHDRLIAYTSHLPHVMAAALVSSPLIEGCSPYTGGSFRDASRVARINPELWADLFLSNADELLPVIETFQRNVAAYQDAIQRKDKSALEELLRDARRSNEKKFD